MRKKRETLAPDLTPIIDIVFILLIFFMVTSVFKKEEVSLALSLPKLHASASQSKSKTILFELNEEALLVDAKAYSFKTLDSYLKSVDKKDLINIKIDKDVKYERVMKLFDMLQLNALTNFSLIAQKAKD